MTEVGIAVTPIARLFELNVEIRQAETVLRQAKTIKRLGRLAIATGLPLFLVAIAAGLLSRDYIDIGEWVWFASFLAIPIIVAAAYYLRADFFNRPILDIDTVEIAELKLSELHERRRYQLAEMGVDVDYRRATYREQLNVDIDGFRRASSRYRNIHNFLQSVIIVFSLVNSTVTGIALDGSPWQWPAVGGSFAVGISAGFMGYFKFRERGFYLQQTADGIQQEVDAAELGISRYANLDSPTTMRILVERVEELKLEQRKREQSLDQPSDGRRDNSA